MQMWRLNALWMLACAFTSGCVSRAVYPETWAQQVQVESGACPVIDGEYQNVGELLTYGKNDRTERTEVSLTGIFNEVAYDTPSEVLGSDQPLPGGDDRPGLPFPELAEHAYRTIRLQLVQDGLRVEAVPAEGGTRTFEVPTRQACRDSTMLLEADWSAATFSLIVNFVDRSTLALGRAEDGSLLVRAGSSGGIFIFQWPLLVGSGAGWIRFPPAALATEPLPLLLATP
jgi:hypothetical protein